MVVLARSPQGAQREFTESLGLAPETVGTIQSIADLLAPAIGIPGMVGALPGPREEPTKGTGLLSILPILAPLIGTLRGKSPKGVSREFIDMLTERTKGIKPQQATTPLPKMREKPFGFREIKPKGISEKVSDVPCSPRALRKFTQSLSFKDVEIPRSAVVEDGLVDFVRDRLEQAFIAGGSVQRTLFGKRAVTELLEKRFVKEVGQTSFAQSSVLLLTEDGAKEAIRLGLPRAQEVERLFRPKPPRRTR